MASDGAKKQIQEIFERFDASGDGVLQLEEMAEVFSALKFKNTWKLLRQIDKSGDELIQVHEFISWLFDKPVRYTVKKDWKEDKEVVEVTFINDFKGDRCFSLTFNNCGDVEFLEGNPASFVLKPGETLTKAVLAGKLPKVPCRYNMRVLAKGVSTDDKEDCDPFVDAEFPPEEKSIDPSGKFEEVAKPELWMRARILGSPTDACLFDQIHPEDVKQGGCGDCWLMGSFASLATHPQKIKSLFDTKQLTKDGKYGVNLFDIETEKWIKITIDEYLPCKINWDKLPVPQMAQPLGNECWVSLLEKAVAKYCGSYAALVGGQALWAFTLLTGETRGFCYRKRGGSATWTKEWMNPKRNPRSPRPGWRWAKGKKLSDDELFELILKHAKDKHVLACSIFPGNGLKMGDITETGLVICHLYSILQVLSETLDDGTPIRFVEVRNPWANTEWNGDWCDWGKGGVTGKENASSKWEENPKLRERIAAHSRYDGAAFMSFEDWVANFTTVSLCPLGKAEIPEDDDVGEMEECDDEK